MHRTGTVVGQGAVFVDIIRRDKVSDRLVSRVVDRAGLAVRAQQDTVGLPEFSRFETWYDTGFGDIMAGTFFSWIILSLSDFFVRQVTSRIGSP